MMKGLLTLTTLCLILLLSSCADESLVPGSSSQTKTPEPASIVGKWNLQALGMITNVKTYETTLDEINTVAKTNTQVAKMAAPLNTLASYEFKEDGTYTFGTDTGKWALSSDKSKIVLTSTAMGTQELVIESLSSTSTKLLGKKYATVQGNVTTTFTSLEETIAFSISLLPMAIKMTNQSELNATTSLQGYTILKR